MPLPGKVTDPDTENAHLTIGKIMTLKNGEIAFVNTCPDLEVNDPVLYEIRHYEIVGDIAVLPEGWDDLKKKNWRNKELHKEWKKYGSSFDKLETKPWKTYHKYKDPDEIKY